MAASLYSHLLSVPNYCTRPSLPRFHLSLGSLPSSSTASSSSLSSSRPLPLQPFSTRRPDRCGAVLVRSSFDQFERVEAASAFISKAVPEFVARSEGILHTLADAAVSIDVVVDTVQKQVNDWFTRLTNALEAVLKASVDIGKKGDKVEELREELEKQAESTKESLNQAVDDLKDEALKAGAGWKATSEESAEKIIGVLRDTTEQLKEQAEKARAVLTATAQETAERSKENLSYIAENAPDPIRDIAETALKAHSPDKKGAKIHDFCLGIPYGGFLVTGGLLWFIISGSTAAIRFGVILGGILLGLSVTSLKVWKQGNSSMPYIVGQAAITLIIMLREIRRFLEVKAFFPSALAAIASAGMLGFYSYVYLSGGNPPKKAKQGAET